MKKMQTIALPSEAKRPVTNQAVSNAVTGRVRGMAAGLLAGLLACGLLLSQPARAGEPERFVPIAATAQSQAMGRGVNVLGYDPVWQNPARARFTPAHFRLIREAGFQHVRIVLQSFAYIDGQGKFNPQWLATLDTMVQAALDQGLTVILDEHDFLACADDVTLCRTKLHAFWSQIAPRYKDAPNRVVFELLNEPHGALTEERWNELMRDTLALIRTSNPQRNVIIGGANWNSFDSLQMLTLPADDHHIIATFHYYRPMAFTHQGAPWADKDIRAMSNVPWGTDADYAALNKEFDSVKAWSVASGRPVLLGEFGAYEHAPLADRLRWDAAAARAAEAHGFPWCYWQFDSDFIVYDIDRKAWVEPVLHALIPQP